MYQVNSLSVDVGKTPDLLGSKGDMSSKNNAKGNAFSNAMEQHYPKKSSTEPDNKKSLGGNLEPKAAENPKLDDKNGEIVKIKRADSDDEHMLPVPLPVDDESSIDNSADVDMPTSFPIDKEAMSLKAEKANNNDAHTLPVPLPIDDESLVTKPLVEGLYTSAPVKIKGGEHTLPVDPVQNKSSNVTSVTQSTEGDDTVDLLKMLNGAQQLLTKSASGNIDDKASEPKNVSNNAALGEQDKIIESIKNTTLNGTQNTKLAAGNEFSDLAVDASNLKAQAEKKAAADNLVEGSLKDPKASLAENSTVLKAQAEAMNASNTDASVSEKNAANGIELLAKQEQTQQANNEFKNVLTADTKQLAQLKEPQAGVDVKTITESQVDELKKAVTSELSRVTANEPTQARNINQNTAAVITASTNDKSTAADEITKLANTSDDEQALMKSSDEKKVNQADKVVSALNPAINPAIDAQAARATTSAAELAAHQAQSFESTISQLTSQTVQTQKSITAMNTETIAIYRKDFADAVKDKVMVMINQKIQQVEIQLDPPEMGNIHVRVNLQNEQAAVQFVVQNQQAKEALEQNMGKLRDMLAENGVDVGDANIEQRQASEQNSEGFDQEKNNGTSSELAGDNVNDNDSISLNVVKASSSGVDYYA